VSSGRCSLIRRRRRSLGRFSMTAAWHLARGEQQQQVQRNAGGLRKPPPAPPAPPLNNSPLFPPAPPSTSQGSYLSRAFNSNVMVVLAVVLFALVVVAVLNTLARCRIIRRLRMQQQLPSPESQQQQQQQQQRHHKGLEKAEIEALPVITYGVDSSKLNVEELDVGSHDCVVCLSEYQKGEKLRLLPLCNHGFHLDCIETWLSLHTSCPVCRHGVLAESTDPQIAANHPTPPPEADHHQQQQEQPSASSQDGASSSAASLGGAGTRLGSALFGSARFGSARTSSQQHMDIEVGADNQLRDHGAAASTSSLNRPSSTRWASLSAILSPGGLARLSSGAAGYRRGRQQQQLRNQAPSSAA
jgi:E3 ubiquitin-protein ligase ATL10/75/76/77/78